MLWNINKNKQVNFSSQNKVSNLQHMCRYAVEQNQEFVKSNQSGRNCWKPVFDSSYTDLYLLTILPKFC